LNEKGKIQAMKPDYDLEERLLDYSARIIRLSARLVNPLAKETDELVRIFVRSTQTAKQRKH
jgi:hypothetical protein